MPGRIDSSEVGAASLHDKAERGAVESLMRAMRRPGDEAQLTQIIHSVGGSDERCAGAMASCLVAAAPRKDAVARLGPVPAGLQLEAEVTLAGATPLGRVDLEFRDDASDFLLYVELKLGSEYGHDQINRYLRALEHSRSESRRALMAVTTHTPQVGEEDAATDPRWLGSARWAAVYDELLALPHRNSVMGKAWKALLPVVRDQRDFGPLDVTPDTFEAWARRDEGESAIRYFLGGLTKPTIEAVDRALVETETSPGAELVMRGRSQFITPWRNRMHFKVRLPGSDEERMRVQFLAHDGEPYFTVEGRYDHPAETVPTTGAIGAATDLLAAQGFECEKDDTGHYWAYVTPVAEILREDEPPSRFRENAVWVVTRLVESGLFSGLAELSPSTPTALPLEET